MTHSRLDSPEEIVPHRSRGYDSEDDGSWSNSVFVDLSDGYAAGGWLCTPGDLVRFGGASGCMACVQSRPPLAAEPMSWRPAKSCQGRTSRPPTASSKSLRGVAAVGTIAPAYSTDVVSPNLLTEPSQQNP